MDQPNGSRAPEIGAPTWDRRTLSSPGINVVVVGSFPVGQPQGRKTTVESGADDGVCGGFRASDVANLSRDVSLNRRADRSDEAECTQRRVGFVRRCRDEGPDGDTTLRDRGVRPRVPGEGPEAPDGGFELMTSPLGNGREENVSRLSLAPTRPW